MSERDAISIMWTAIALGSYLDPSLRNQLESRAEELSGRLPNLNTGAFDTVDWGMTKAVLDSVAVRVGTLGVTTALQKVEATINSFTDLALALAKRRKGKAVINVEDEYDVQDILYVGLKASFPDLEREDPTPKDMGASKRVDLLSAAHKIVVEVKMVRDQKHAQEVFDEIKIDVQSYHTHPACQELVIFVYDPQKLIPSALHKEKEFSGRMEIRTNRSLDVTLRIRP